MSFSVRDYTSNTKKQKENQGSGFDVKAYAAKKRGATISAYTPTEYTGIVSDAERRRPQEEAKPATSGYTPVADLNRASNGAGASPLEQAARDMARIYRDGTTQERQDRGALLRGETMTAPENSGAWDRIKRTVTGGAKQSASGHLGAIGAYTEAAGALSEAAATVTGNSGRVRAAEREAERNRRLAETAKTPEMQEYYARKTERAEREARAATQPTIDSAQTDAIARNLYNTSDALAVSGAEDIARAKEGAGFLGGLAVDLGAQATQIVGDRAIGALTGLGGLAPMIIRSFGGGAQEARLAGASLGQQLGYGAANALVEGLTESMFDGLAGAYGKGTADEVVKNIINRIAKNDAAKRALTVAAAAAGESAEELASGIAGPFIRAIYNGKSIGQNWSETQLADIGYDMLVGGLLGSVGGGVEVASDVLYQAALGRAEKEEAAADTQEQAATQQVTTAPAGVSEAGPVVAPATNDRTGISKPSTTKRMGESKAREPLPLRGVSEQQLDRDLADAARLSVTLGRSGANAFLTAYDRATAASVEPTEAFESFSKVYNAAVKGKNAPEVSVPEHLRIAAQGAGENDARMAAQAQYFGENAGLAPNRSGWPRNLSRREARVLDAMGKAAGVQIKFADTMNGANASIEKGVLTIAKDADDPVRAAFTHEIVHRVRESAPEAYSTLAQFVVDNMSDERLASAIRARSDTYSDMNYSISDITEETVADAFGRMASEPELLEKIAGVDRTAAQKILDAIDELLRKIKATLSGKKQAQLTANQIEAFRDLQGRGEEMAKALRAALQKVQEQAQTANKNAATEDGAARYSKNENFASDIQTWYNNGQASGEQFVLGETGEALQGLGAIESDIYMNGDKITSILNDHLEMTVDVIKKIPQVLDDPVLVLKSKNNVRSQYGNSRLVMFGNVKAEDGRPVMCVLDLRPTENGFLVDDMQKVSSAYTKDANPVDFVRESEVLHADKKRSLPLLRGIGFTGPMSLLRNGSVGSITYNKQKVNIKGEPFSSVFDETGNGNVRFSRNVDSEGRELTEAQQDEQTINELRERANELTERLDFSGANDLSETEERRLRNELVKTRAEFDKMIAKERRMTKSTSLVDILENLDGYRRSDLESLAEQISDSAWDDYEELSDDELRDALRDMLTERANDLNELERQAPKYGFDVRPVSKAAQSVGINYDTTELQKSNTQNGGVRFSLKEPVEATPDLLAIHNMSEKNLRDALELGGLPMPSIAVVKAATGHSKFGPISLIFGADTIDPQITKRNKVYGGDAYTPTAPSIGFKLDSKTIKRMQNRVHDILGDEDRLVSLSLDESNLSDRIHREGGDFKAAYRKNDALQYAFLKEAGVVDHIPTKEKKWSSKASNYQLKKLVESFDIRELREMGFEETMSREPEIRELLLRSMVEEKGGGEMIEKAARVLYDKPMSFAMLNSIIHDAARMTSGESGIETDDAKLNDMLKNAMMIDGMKDRYDDWLDELSEGIIAKKGIRNNKDFYTPSGNRRSFEALYDDYTLENIVKAMRGGEERGSDTFGVNAKTLQSVTTPFYGSVADIKRDSGRLGAVDEKEYEERKAEIDERINEALENVYNTTKHWSDNRFIEYDSIAEAIINAARGARTVSSIMRSMQKDGYSISESVAEELRGIYDDTANMPTEYFEAKLQRAVDFDEVLAAVVPDSLDKGLIERLRNEGLNVVEYAADDDADRLEKVNSVEGARFSRKSVADAEAREAALLQENDLLRDEIKYWKAQLERTPKENVGIVDPNAVRKTAKKLISDYGSTLAHGEITNELQDLYNLMGTGSDSRGELSYESAREIADSVARKIAENAVDDTESAYRMYEDLRSFLRTMNLTVTAAETAEIADWGNWRKRNFGRMQVKRGEASNIDRIYDELSDAWPEFFPGDVITVGDQLNRIAEVADYLYSDRGHNPYDPYMDQAVIDIGNDIMERFFDLPQAKTFADKQAAKIETLRVQMSELRARDSERLQRSLAKVRESRDKQIERMTERFRAKTDAGRERQSAAKLRKQIMRHTSALSQKLLRPTDKQHIPDSLRTPVAAMLEAINKESAYDIVTDENGRNKRVPRGEGDVLTKRTQAFAELKKQYAELKDDENLVIDPDLLGDEAAGFQGLFDQVLAMSGTPIQRMSTEQLQTIWKVVRAVEHSVSTYGKTLSAAKFKTTADWAFRFRSDADHRKDRATIGGKDISLGLENPYTFFSQYGESGKAIFRMLRDAQDTQRRRMDRIADAVHGIADSKTVKKLRETRQEFTTKRGDTLTLTTAQVMELYNLTKREQAQNHLLKGGIVQPEIPAAGKQKRIERGTDMIRLTQEDLGELAALLTPEQMEIADELQQLTATTLAEWGNEASMAAYGYRKFTEQNYWPIHTAQEALHSKVENDRSNPRSIKNIGMAKALVPNASNAVSVGDVFTTFAEHAADMLDYSSWLLPMEDANRLFNFKYKGDDGYPASTFKQELDRVGGRNGKAQKYWTDLMADIQNGLDRTSRSDLEGLAARGIGNVKGASVGANLRVIVQQPTAYLRANAVMNPESLTKGLIGGVTRGNGWQKAQQYAAIARIKDVGGFDQGSTRSVSNELYGDRTALEKVGDIAGRPAGKADAVTWGALWNAAEWETKRLHPDIAEGSAAFYQKTAEIFTDTIDQTQVVDGVLQRSAIMRSGDRLTQQMTAFMGEPIMALNLMLRSYDNVRYAKTKEQRGAAIRQLGRAVVTLAVTDIVNSAVQSLVDALRKDDKDKKYWERFMTALTGLEGDEKTAAERLKNIYLEGNFADNASLIGKIPLAKDLRSILQGFTVERLDAGAISDLMQSAQQLASGKYAPIYGAYRVAEQAAKIVGIPATNLERDVHAAVRSIFYAIGDPKLLYEYEKAIFNSRSTKNKSRFFDTAYMALEQGDTATYETIRNDLVDKMGVSSFDVDDDMKRRYNKAVKEDGAYTLPQAAADLLALRQKYSVKTETEEETFKAEDLGAAAYTRYSNQRARDYKTYKDALEKTTEFRKLSAEDKDRALNWAYSLADEMALEENSEGQYKVTDKWKTYAKDAKRYGISMTNYLTFHMVAETTSSTRDKEGKEVKGQKKADKIRDWLENRRGLTDGQRAWLWGTIYSSEW